MSSVLEEVSEHAPAKILERDPSEWTDKDLDELVTFLRNGRAVWQKEEEEARSKGTRPKTAKGTSAKTNMDPNAAADLLKDLL